MNAFIEEKVAAYKEVVTQIKELEEKKQSLAAEILESFPVGEKCVRLKDCQVKRYMRLSISTPLSIAKTLGVVKLQEVLDRQKIKELYSTGQEIPNVVETHYISLSRLPSDE